MNEPQEFHAAPRRRARLTIFFTILLDLIGFGMIVPFLTFYAQEFHATPLLIGLLFSSYSLTQLLFAPLLGRLSDRLGRRPVLLASIAGSVVAYALFAAAPNYAVLLLARALAGVAAANYALAQAYLADITPPEGRAKAMGLVGAAFGIGFVLGPALGGLLAHAGSLIPILAGLGPRIVPIAAGLLAAINLAFAATSLPESLSPELRRQAGLRAATRQGSWLGLAELREVWRDSPLRGLMLLFFLVMFCFAIMETTLALFCQARFGYGARETSWLFVFVGVILVIVQGGLIGRLVQRFGERRMILGGILLMALGLAVLPLAPVSIPPAGTALALLLAGLLLLAAGQGIHSPSSLGLLSRLTAQESQGSTIGLSRSFGALARILGPAAGTLIFATAGAGWPFWTAAALMLVAFAIAVKVLRQAPQINPADDSAA